MQKHRTTISILGCGWLGMPLASHLLQKGFFVKGSKTTDAGCLEMQEKGIVPFKILVDTELTGTHTAAFFDCDLLIISLPPKRRVDIESYYQLQLRAIITELKKGPATAVLFISSTAVYPDTNAIVTETEQRPPDKTSGKALLLAEKIVQEETQFKTTVIRFAGLIGYDRLPGNFLAGKKMVPNGDAPVNLIHRDDCIELIYQVIQNNVWGETFNAAADEHPVRKTYYTSAAQQIGLTPPEFIPDCVTTFKLISSEKIKQQFNYQFIHPDPMKLVAP